jgi:hypothetical protein
MGRHYYGDIEGKFWFAVQSSYDADFFGVEHKKIYNRKCGCTYSEHDECGCTVEHEHNFSIKNDNEDDESSNENVCPENCDKIEDENSLDLESFSSIEYCFTLEHIHLVRKGIEKCKYKLRTNKYDMDYKSKLDEFFDEVVHSYTDDMICEKLHVDEAEVYKILKWYARMMLGMQILSCLEERGKCSFECDL